MLAHHLLYPTSYSSSSSRASEETINSTSLEKQKINRVESSCMNQPLAQECQLTWLDRCRFARLQPHPTLGRSFFYQRLHRLSSCPSNETIYSSEESMNCAEGFLFSFEMIVRFDSRKHLPHSSLISRQDQGSYDKAHRSVHSSWSSSPGKERRKNRNTQVWHVSKHIHSSLPTIRHRRSTNGPVLFSLPFWPVSNVALQVVPCIYLCWLAQLGFYARKLTCNEPILFVFKN